MPNASRCLLWLVLAGPVAVQTVRYLAEAIYYGEYLHWTGVQATRLLILTLAVTPLRLLLPRTRWISWLVARRRDLGLATFLYAALHALAYLLRKADAGTILEEAMQSGMLVGWIGLLVLLALAATSNDYSVRALRGRWKVLHRGIYAAALLTFAHWILTAFDPGSGYLHLAVAVALLAVRAWPLRGGRRSARSSGSGSAP